MAGLVGAGRTEVLGALFGVDSQSEWRESAWLAELRTIANPRDAIDAGLALVPEDRKQQGSDYRDEHPPQHRHARGLLVTSGQEDC